MDRLYRRGSRRDLHAMATAKTFLVGWQQAAWSAAVTRMAGYCPTVAGGSSIRRVARGWHPRPSQLNRSLPCKPPPRHRAPATAARTTDAAWSAFNRASASASQWCGGSRDRRGPHGPRRPGGRTAPTQIADLRHRAPASSSSRAPGARSSPAPPQPPARPATPPPPRRRARARRPRGPAPITTPARGPRRGA